jgi:hypothetical protein
MATSMSGKISSFLHPSTKMCGRIDQISVGPKVCQKIDPTKTKFCGSLLELRNGIGSMELPEDFFVWMHPFPWH